MAELIPTSTEAEWLQARRAGVTASEIPVILGLSPWSSPFALFHEKTGTIASQPDQGVMERGRVLEPYIAGKFAERHPEFAVEGDGRQLYRHPERPSMMATPDRMLSPAWTADNSLEAFSQPYTAVLECKVQDSDEEWGDEGTSDIPAHYMAQVAWQMDVMGVDTAFVAALSIREWRIREYIVTHDESPVIEYPHRVPGPLAPGICRLCGDLELMHREAEAFLLRVATGDEPDVDWRPATIGALKAIYDEPGELDVPVRPSLAIQYRAAVRRCKEAERRKDEMTARMLAAIGSGRRAVDRNGEPLATRSVSHPKRIDTQLLRSKHPDVARECTRDPKPEVKLTPAKESKK